MGTFGIFPCVDFEESLWEIFVLFLRLSLLDAVGWRILCVEVFLFWPLPVFSVCEEERIGRDRLAPLLKIIVSN
jgi:hypothetical protein